MILIAYDGSPDATAAIERAGQLLPGVQATVLVIWEPFLDLMTRSGAAMSVGMVDAAAIDHAADEEAHTRAQDGAELARQAGLDARARTRRRVSTVADAILSEADMLGATAIVLGTRGLTGIKSKLLGSVSNAVLQHADRPVIVIPSEQVAHDRAVHYRAYQRD
jgi:nucleotide-binding universal stress UspA family protein